ncbi:MAG: glycosyltransferase, partial [Dehalococcoidia bacterium]
MSEARAQRKIAIYLPSLRGGGAERAMALLAGGIAERGYAVDLVLAKAEGPYLDGLHPDVRVVDLQARRVLTSLPGLIRYLRRERPVALLSTLYHANVVAILARWLSWTRPRLAVREANTFSQSERGASRMRERLALALAKLLYSRAGAVVAVSQGVGDDLRRRVPALAGRLHVIHNPVAGPELVREAGEAVSHPWFAPGQPPVVLAVGRLEPQKDYPTLLSAFARAARSRSARLVVLGEGSQRQALETLARELGVEDSVDLPGFQANPFAYMARAAVFVLSSAWEGLPNVLIQAMACGTPVVSTDCPSGPSEVLEDGKWGRLVPVGDAEALAEAILATLDAPVDPGALKARAAEFSVDRAVDLYLEVMG